MKLDNFQVRTVSDDLSSPRSASLILAERYQILRIVKNMIIKLVFPSQHTKNGGPHESLE
jgi:hypothetical protein